MRHLQIPYANRAAEMRKPRFDGPARFLFLGERQVCFYGSRESVLGDGAYRQAHAAICRALQYLPAGGRALQHR